MIEFLFVYTYGGRRWQILTAAQDEILVSERCTMQYAQNVARNVKSHSSQQKVNQFSVETVFRRKDLNDIEDK